MDERRRYKRFKANLLITTLYHDEAGGITVEDTVASEDISAGGLRLVFPRQLPKGKVLDIKIFLFPDPIHLPAQGKVIWSSEKQQLKVTVNDKRSKTAAELFWIGIQFIDINSFTRERIIHWIKKQFNVQDIEA